MKTKAELIQAQKEISEQLHAMRTEELKLYIGKCYRIQQSWNESPAIVKIVQVKGYLFEGLYLQTSISDGYTTTRYVFTFDDAEIVDVLTTEEFDIERRAFTANILSI